MRLLGTATEYAFVNARIRGIKSRFLTFGDYERLIQSSDYEDFLKNLSMTYYGAIISSGSFGESPSPEDIFVLLSKDFANITYRLTRTLTGKTLRFTETYLNLFLAESLKSIIRGVEAKLDRDEILRFVVPISPDQAQVFATLVDSGSVPNLVEMMPYWDIRLSLLTRLHAYDTYGSTAPLEVAIEEWYLRSMLDALSDFSYDEKKRVLSILEPRVDLRNALTMVRGLRMGLHNNDIALSLARFTARSNALREALLTATTWQEVFAKLEKTRYRQFATRLAKIYEESDDLGEVELLIEDSLAQRMKSQLTAYPFHIGTVIGFFGLKYYEIRNINSIAVGVERGESAETIRKMITIW